MPDQQQTRNTSSYVREIVLWMGLILIIFLTGLSIYGSFIGSEKASDFFTSPKLAVFWLALTIVLTAGLVLFPGLQRQPGSLAMHGGCVLILIGAMWGSDPGHGFHNHFFKTNRIPHAGMVIDEGQSSNILLDESFRQPILTLPFAIKLNDFDIDYYFNWGKLYILTSTNQQFSMPARAGVTLDIPEINTKFEILNIFKNYKMKQQGDQVVIYDEPDGINPAVRMRISQEGQEPYNRTVFFLHPDFGNINAQIQMRYVLMPKEYLSDLTVLVDDRAIKQHRLEVNKPLYHGGYYFYQTSYDEQNFSYTVLSVTSDLGYPLVFGGYGLLCLGAIWHFWVRPALEGHKNKKESRGEDQ